MSFILQKKPNGLFSQLSIYSYLHQLSYLPVPGFLSLFLWVHGNHLASFSYSSKSLLLPSSFGLLPIILDFHMVQALQYNYIYIVHTTGVKEETGVYTVLYNDVITLLLSSLFHEDLSQSGLSCFQPKELSLIFLIREVYQQQILVVLSVWECIVPSVIEDAFSGLRFLVGT